MKHGYRGCLTKLFIRCWRALMPILEMQQDVTSQVQGVGQIMDVICVRNLEALAKARHGVVPELCSGRW